jgi:hypothetical protein
MKENFVFCANCGEGMEVTQGRGRPNKYCSDACRNSKSGKNWYKENKDRLNSERHEREHFRTALFFFVLILAAGRKSVPESRCKHQRTATERIGNSVDLLEYCTDCDEPLMILRA